MTKVSNTKALVMSFAIIAIAFAVAVVANLIIGAWAFIPVAIAYWASIFIVVKPVKEKLVRAFAAPTENRKYVFIAFVPVLFSIVSFVWGIQYISGVFLVISWVLFAFFNSVAEEMFWRGYLFDNLSWKPLFKVVVSTALFVLSHLSWGVFSVTIRNPFMIGPLLIMGATWGYVYHKAKSLKWPIIAHFIVNILTLTVWVFLNIYVPPIA